MEKLVTWWCHLIGIADERAIQFAVGNVAAGTFLLIAVLLVYVLFLGALFAFAKGHRPILLTLASASICRHAPRRFPQ